LLSKKLSKKLIYLLSKNVYVGKMGKFDEQLLEKVKKLIQKAPNSLVKIGLSAQEERKLQKIDPDLFDKYIKAKEKVEKNRNEFRENINKIIDKINSEISKYNANAFLSEFDDNAVNHPGHYCITIKIMKRLPREQFTELTNELKQIGFKYNGYNWEYCNEIGNYPNLNVK